MQTTCLGQDSLIVYGGRYFADCDDAREHVLQTELALVVLSVPSVTYPNGRNSYEVANEVLDKAEDRLIEFRRFVLA